MKFNKERNIQLLHDAIGWLGVIMVALSLMIVGHYATLPLG